MRIIFQYTLTIYSTSDYLIELRCRTVFNISESEMVYVKMKENPSVFFQIAILIKKILSFSRTRVY